MRLLEWEAKQLLRGAGIAVPRSALVSGAGGLRLVSFPGPYVVKAQVPFGGRGKAGLIKACGKQTLRQVVASLLNKRVHGTAIRSVLVERKVSHQQERYLSLAIDRSRKTVVALVSAAGGMDIEAHPEAVQRFPVRFEQDLRKIAVAEQHARTVELLVRLYRLMQQRDAELIEINPLVFAGGEPVALDAKIIIDDNALFRQPFRREDPGMNAAEQQAKSRGLNYVELDGDIGVIGNGAGLVMATMDTIHAFGGKPKNFLDIGGGADRGKMEEALDIVLSAKPRKLLVNIFGGITRCDEIATGIVEYRKRYKIRIPMVVRMIGTHEREGRRLLEKNRIHALDSMETAIRKVVAL